MRLQLALNVTDIDEAVEYYNHLFGAEPHKRRAGYANYRISSPPLKLVLFEHPDAPERLNHLGVEVEHETELKDAESRLQDAGILDQVENNTTCCHAVQDKLWSREPQGLRWEWYRITDDMPASSPHPDECGQSPEQGVCCA